MKACPKCGNDRELWIQCIANVSSGKFVGLTKRVEAWCAGPCEQRFWWYRETGRITQRNTGTVDW